MNDAVFIGSPTQVRPEIGPHEQRGLQAIIRWNKSMFKATSDREVLPTERLAVHSADAHDQWRFSCGRIVFMFRILLLLMKERN